MDILFEDNHLIAVNKGNSQIVQPDLTGDSSLEEEIKQYIKDKYNKPGEAFLGVIHRIDRPVSGVVLFARTSKALERMNRLFAGREVEKRYWAIVKKVPPHPSGTLEHYILRNTKQNKSFAYPKEVPGSQLARLQYQILAASERYHLLEINLETGRHHQIRCQLAALGCPIKGDLKYGADRSNPGGGISLHARSLKFNHPVKNEQVEIFAPPPKDPLWEAFLNILKVPC